MDVFVYSDESGVFDKVHSDVFVFGGLILYEPLFSSMKGVDLHFCNSATTTLIRAADHVANDVYHESLTLPPPSKENFHITILP